MNCGFSWNGLVGVEWLFAVTLASLTVLGVALYLRPARLPGPLLKEERHSRRVTLSALVLPVLLLVTVAASMSLAIDIHGRRTLLLVSRARQTTADCQRVTWPGAASAALTCSVEGVDLGPIVDEALSGLDRDRLRSLRPSEVVALVGPALRRAMTRLGEHDATFVTADRHTSDLPRWLIDSVELELVEAALADDRFDRLLVAPGPFEMNSMWQTIAEFTAERGIETMLVDERETPAHAHVQSIPLATYQLDGRVEVWALITGELREGRRFMFSMKDAAANLDEHSFLAAPDDFERRLVQFSAPCSRCAGLQRELSVVAGSDGVTTAEAKLLPAALRQELGLSLGKNLDSRTEKQLRFLLSSAFAGTRQGQHVSSELAGLGIPLPTLARPDALDAVRVEQSGPALLVAATAQALSAASEWRARHNPGGKPTELELSHNKLGPNTVWSLERVTALTQPGLDTATEQGALSAFLPDRVTVDRRRTHSIAGLGVGWGALMLPVPKETTESLETVPFLRTLAWTAAHAKFGDPLLETMERENLSSAPIRTIATQRGDRREARLAIRELVLLGALFACYLVGWRRVRRTLQTV